MKRVLRGLFKPHRTSGAITPEEISKVECDILSILAIWYLPPFLKLQTASVNHCMAAPQTPGKPVAPALLLLPSPPHPPNICSLFSPILKWPPFTSLSLPPLLFSASVQQMKRPHQTMDLACSLIDEGKGNNRGRWRNEARIRVWLREWGWGLGVWVEVWSRGRWRRGMWRPGRERKGGGERKEWHRTFKIWQQIFNAEPHRWNVAFDGPRRQSTHSLIGGLWVVVKAGNIPYKCSPFTSSDIWWQPCHQDKMLSLNISANYWYVRICSCQMLCTNTNISTKRVMSKFTFYGYDPGDKAVKPLTTVQDCISTYIYTYFWCWEISNWVYDHKNKTFS